MIGIPTDDLGQRVRVWMKFFFRRMNFGTDDLGRIVEWIVGG